MIKLTQKQIIFIAHDLKSKGLSKGFSTEILDHLSCQIEEKINLGIVFKEAYHQSLSDYGEQGFEELKKTSPIVIQKNKVMLTQLSTVFIASVLMFFTFNFIKADPPSSHPLEEGVTITSGFGLRLDPISKKERPHTGIDFRGEIGTPIRATADDIISELTNHIGGYGKKLRPLQNPRFDFLLIPEG